MIDKDHNGPSRSLPEPNLQDSDLFNLKPGTLNDKADISYLTPSTLSKSKAYTKNNKFRKNYPWSGYRSFRNVMAISIQ